MLSNYKYNMQQQTIDTVLDLDIVPIIEKYVALKKRGVNYIGSCPFHNEKTSSFTVSPAKNIFKCFGCGEGGNAISFVMKHDKINFPEAIKKLCHDNGIKYEEKKRTDEEIKEDKKREAIAVVNSLAMKHFSDNLFKEENALALEYALSRWDKKTIEEWNIGFAPDSWQNITEWAKENQIKTEILLETSLIKESSDKRLYDFFRNRLIFPFHDKIGRVVGFTGRLLKDEKDQPKYMNTGETELYKKSEILFGYHLARTAIKEKKNAYLVEGNPDVISLHKLGIINTVAPCGTSFTKEQLQLLKSITPHITIIGDSDNAGQKAVAKISRMIIEAGMTVAIIPLPNEKDTEGNQIKHDPDSYFKTAEQFAEYKKEHKQDYIISLATQLNEKADNTTSKAEFINEICTLISHLDSTIATGYIDELGKISKPKSKFEKKYNEIISDRNKAIRDKDKTDEVREEAMMKLPHGVDRDAYFQYGFYEHKNRYYFNTGKSVIEGSNFVMKPLFHVESVLNSKRLYQITNEYGISRVIELNQEDLIALSRFKKRVESLGNFIWQTDEICLTKLKRYLYEKTESCLEITQMGWQKQGFFAWGNGISSSEFIPVDKFGISKVNGRNYYMPAFSEVYKDEQSLFFTERKFIFAPGDISLYDISDKMMKVYGNNAAIGLCFYFASLFRDIIVRHFNFFPLLNLFGPKGAGKTELAVSIMQFFGHMPKGPNINNTTKPALADTVAQCSNAVCHIDEYKNSIEFEKIEFLKGLWDGTGRTRMNMDKDKKKETTAVDCGIMISGQEMPTADIALFSRLVFITFSQTEYNDQEKERFNELKTLEKISFTHITHEILKHRKHFEANFIASYDQVSIDFNEALDGQIIEDRIFRNWLLLIAAYHCIKDFIILSFTYEELIKIAIDGIRRQNKETKKSNELSVFWSIIEYLTRDGLLEEGIDFKIKYTNKINTDMAKVELEEPINLLYLNHSRVFHLYRKHGKNGSENILPIKTLEYYLMNSKEYKGKKMSEAFNIKDVTSTINKKYQITTAMTFNYDNLGVSLHSEENAEIDKPF